MEVPTHLLVTVQLALRDVTADAVPEAEQIVVTSGNGNAGKMADVRSCAVCCVGALRRQVDVCAPTR